MAAVFLLQLFFISCKGESKKEKAHRVALIENALSVNQYIKETENQKREAVKDFILSLPMDEMLSEIFLVNLEGNEDFKPVEFSDGKPLIPGGYIFFSYNLSEKPEGIISFTESISDYCTSHDSIQPFLSIDVEGGYVNRLRGIAGPLPEAFRVSQCLTPDKAFQLYNLNALQLKALGFNIDLSPVTEVLASSNEIFLDGRSFGTKEQVVQYASNAVSAYEKNNVGTVLKHFPGNTNVDPHLGLPKISMNRTDFEKNVLYPFGEVIKKNPSMILMSHAILSIEDENLNSGKNIPSCFSDSLIQETLRKKLGFEGIIISDDIFMKALEANGYAPEKAVSMSLMAGVNCIMMSEKQFKGELEIVKKLYSESDLYQKKILDSVCRIVEWKIKAGLLTADFIQGKWSISKKRISSGSTSERLREFSSALEKNDELYEKYFLSTADESELNAVKFKAE